MNLAVVTAASVALTLPLGAANFFTAEHGDVFAIGFEDGTLEPHVHIEGGVVNGVFIADDEYEPDDLTTVVPQSTFDYITSIGGRPAGADWDPLGVLAGESFYFLPQVDAGAGGADALGSPFAGIGTEELTAADWSSVISIQLLSLSGPGDFSFWQDGLSPNFFMSSADGISGADVFSQPAGGHDHANWGFTEPGNYDITVRVSGTHVTDGFQTADATYSFAVGIPEPSAAILSLFAGLGLIVRRRR